jgi:hypothetical protein
MPERDLKTVRDEETRIRTNRSLLEARQIGAGRRIFTGGVGSPSPLRGLKVTGLWDVAGSAWENFEDAGDSFLAFVSGHPCRLDGSGVRLGRTIYAKATASPDTAPSGFETVEVGHVVGYVAGDGTEAVPGTDPEEYFAGVLVPNAGANGALLTARVVD